MKQQYFLLLVFSFLICLRVRAQEAGELFISINANQYVPLGDTQKKIFPFFSYDKDSDPRFAIGGFGAGVSYFRKHSEKVTWKAQANVSKYRYWDAPIEMREETNQSLGSYLFTSVDYSLGVAAIAHYSVGKRFSVGAGLAAQVMIASRSKPRNNSDFGGNWANIPNNHYKPIMPTVPLELSLKYEKMFFSLRYEQALLNRIRGDLAEVKSETFGLVMFEVGRKIK